MPKPNLDAALTALIAGARRVSVARRIAGDVEERLLQTIVDATVRLFHAEAASIALHERDPERLEFRVASGARGSGAVGVSVAPTQGIAGYVFSTGQALALSDVASDPRFDRATAERTGYVPRSIAAIPLVDDHGTVGVLQVLDKRDSATFSLRDMELLGVFAGQATAAIGVARVQRDAAQLLAAALTAIAPGLDATQLEELVSSATRGLDPDTDAPFWQVVDQVSRLRSMTDRELALVADLLEVVVGHAERGQRSRVRR